MPKLLLLHTYTSTVGTAYFDTPEKLNKKLKLLAQDTINLQEGFVWLLDHMYYNNLLENYALRNTVVNFANSHGLSSTREKWLQDIKNFDKPWEINPYADWYEQDLILSRYYASLDKKATFPSEAASSTPHTSSHSPHKEGPR